MIVFLILINFIMSPVVSPFLLCRPGSLSRPSTSKSRECTMIWAKLGMTQTVNPAQNILGVTDIHNAEHDMLIEKFREDVMKIRRTQSSSLLSLPMSLFPPFAFERRWLQAILVGGNSVKEALIEEWGMHVLAEALFVTITAAPLFSGYLFSQGDHNFLQYTLYALLYTTTMAQAISIFSNIICLCAAIEIPQEVFLKWILSNNRLNSVVVTGRMHSVSTYLFLSTMVLWPMAAYDDINIKIICTTAAVMPVVLYLTGPFQTLLHEFYPLVHHMLYPEDVAVQQAVDADFALLFGSRKGDHDEKEKEHEVEKPVFLLNPASAEDYSGSIESKSEQKEEGAIPTVFTSTDIYESPAGAVYGVEPLTALATETLPHIVPFADPSATHSIESFLSTLNLSEFTATFHQHRIELSMIPDLLPGDFKELGVPVGDRIKLQQGYKSLAPFTSKQKQNNVFAKALKSISRIFSGAVSSVLQFLNIFRRSLPRRLTGSSPAASGLS